MNRFMAFLVTSLLSLVSVTDDLDQSTILVYSSMLRFSSVLHQCVLVTVTRSSYNCLN